MAASPSPRGLHRYRHSRLRSGSRSGMRQAKRQRVGARGPPPWSILMPGCRAAGARCRDRPGLHVPERPHGRENQLATAAPCGREVGREPRYHRPGGRGARAVVASARQKRMPGRRRAQRRRSLAAQQERASPELVRQKETRLQRVFHVAAGMVGARGRQAPQADERSATPAEGTRAKRELAERIEKVQREKSWLQTTTPPSHQQAIS